MSVEIQKIKLLLKDVKKIQKHQQEIEKIKGETFNIFSILGVETKENKTHSNFIAELLNPNGSHYMGHAFLQAFLDQINYNGNLDVNIAEVFTEFHIGNITETTGGRIDILIKDNQENCISIENKIYAGDQENQLVRYHNFQEGKNELYYLTLFGDEASEHSTKCTIEGETYQLTCNEDYQAISYQTHILQWLEDCQRIAVDVPQLREAIKQYILLIKKLTNQMVDPKNLELRKAIFDNAEAAQYVADNFYNIRNEIRLKFRKDIYEILLRDLDKDKFEVIENNGVHKKQYAQIFIFLREINNKTFFYSIETFSDVGNIERDLYIGIIDTIGDKADYKVGELSRNFEEKWWKAVKIFKYNGEYINLSNSIFLKNLINPESDLYKNIVKKVASDSIEFINAHSNNIIAYFEQKNIKPLG